MSAALPARSHALAHTHAPSLASSDARSPRPHVLTARVAPTTPTLLLRSADRRSHTLNTRSVALAEAIRCFRRALAHGDRDTAAKQLAALYAAGGDSERAAKYFRRVLTLHDEDKVGARALALWGDGVGGAGGRRLWLQGVPLSPHTLRSGVHPRRRHGCPRRMARLTSRPVGLLSPGSPVSSTGRRARPTPTGRTRCAP